MTTAIAPHQEPESVKVTTREHIVTIPNEPEPLLMRQLVVFWRGEEWSYGLFGTDAQAHEFWRNLTQDVHAG